jgi:hypothetical protein
MTGDVQMAIVDKVSNVDGHLCVDCYGHWEDGGGLLEEWQVCIVAHCWDQHRMVYFYAPNVSIGIQTI